MIVQASGIFISQRKRSLILYPSNPFFQLPATSLSLERSVFSPTPGPLHMLCPLPRTRSSPVVAGLAVSVTLLP